MSRFAQLVSVFSKINRGTKSSYQWGCHSKSLGFKLVHHSRLYNCYQENQKIHSSRLILAGIAAVVTANKEDQTSAYELGDFRKAEKLFKEMLRRIIIEGTPPNDNAVIHISAKLACLYGMFNDDLKAKQGFKFCISNLKEKLTTETDDFDTKALYSLALSWYGEYLHSKGNNFEALNLFQESLEISKSINGTAHPHSLLQLNNMAAAYSLMNQFDNAASCLKEAINLTKNQSEHTSIDLPYYYINLVNIYLTQLDTPNDNSPLLVKAASDACTEAFLLAKKNGDKEALMEVEKCRNDLKKHVIE